MCAGEQKERQRAWFATVYIHHCNPVEGMREFWALKTLTQLSFNGMFRVRKKELEALESFYFFKFITVKSYFKCWVIYSSNHTSHLLLTLSELLYTQDTKKWRNSIHHSHPLKSKISHSWKQAEQVDSRHKQLFFPNHYCLDPIQYIFRFSYYFFHSVLSYTTDTCTETLNTPG